MDKVIAPAGADTGLLGAGEGAGAGAGFAGGGSVGSGAGFVGSGVGWLEVVPEFEEPLFGAELPGALGEGALDEVGLDDAVLWELDAVGAVCFRPLQPANMKAERTRGTQ